MPTLARATVLLSLLLGSGAAAATPIEVLTTRGCGCCRAWVEYMAANGFPATVQYLALADLWQRKLDAGLRDGQTSCHTALVDGYVVEGHVPAREVARLLDERPEAIGLTVPDMPYGSPGMGDPGDAEPYNVLLIRRDGSSVVYASYGPPVQP